MPVRFLLSAARVLIATLLVVGCSDSTSPATSANLIGAKSPLSDQASATGLAASVIAVNPPRVGCPVDVIVAVPAAIDNAARNGNANFTLYVTLTYVSTDNTVETIDSGLFPIERTLLFYVIDNKTVAIKLALFCGSKPAPGPNPSFLPTAEIIAP